MRTCTLLAVLLAVRPLSADELPPPDKPIESVIDYFIDAELQKAGVRPAPQIDDANLIRRLTLDLVGRIPTVSEVQEFTAARETDKRAHLVTRLLSSPAFVRQQATEFDALLMAGSRASIRDYLLKAFAENRSWDQVFRDLVVADERDPKQKGSAEFLKQYIKDLDKLTNEVSTKFFGVNISCAQCHDHPKAPDWKQDHFFGMKSFFNRTFDNGGFVAEREYGPVKFRTKAGVEKTAKLMFLTGKVAAAPGDKEPSGEEQKKERARFEEFKKNKQAPPPPSISARAKLVDLALQPGQRDFFARAIVNRTWARFFGRGLVTPLDQMHSENPPSHPDLLQWLARDTVEHGYDLRRLIRGLVLSQAYSRGSRWDMGDIPLASLFAVGVLRPLTPMQLATSLRLATTDPRAAGLSGKPQEQEKYLESLENSARGLARFIEQPGEDFQIGVSEALLFSNSDRIQAELLGDGGDRLVGRLKQIKDPKEQIDLAVRTVLSRPARADEAKLFEEFLKQRADRPVDGCRQLVWALVTSAEFRFNY